MKKFIVPIEEAKTINLFAENENEAAVKAISKGYTICGKIIPFAKAAKVEATATPEAAAEPKAAEPKAKATATPTPKPKAEPTEAASIPEATATATATFKDSFDLKSARKGGAELDSFDSSLKGLCRKVENECTLFNVNSLFFVKAFKAYIGASFVLPTDKDTDKAAAIDAKFAEFTDTMLLNSLLYRGMKNHNKLYATFKANLCRFYTEEGTKLAKVKRIAFAVDGLSSAEKLAYAEKANKENPTHKLVIIDGAKYYVSNTTDSVEVASMLTKCRRQVRTDFAAVDELPIAWKNEKGDIMTLVEKTSFGYTELTAVFAKAMFVKASGKAFIQTNVGTPEAAAEKAAKAAKKSKKAKATATPEAAAAEPEAKKPMEEPKAKATATDFADLLAADFADLMEAM